MWKNSTPYNSKGFLNKTEQLDFSLPEAIRVDPQRLAPFPPAGPEQPPLFPNPKVEQQAPFPQFIPEGRDDLSRFKEQIAKCHEGLDNTSAMRARLEQSISNCRSLGKAGALPLADALQQLGTLYHRESNHREALNCYEESLSALRGLPVSEVTVQAARALKQMGSIYYEVRRLAQAFHYFEKALDITEKQPSLPTDAERLEAAAIATLSAAIRMELSIEEPARTIGRDASYYITLADKYMTGLNEEDYLIKKRSEELKYMNRVLKGLL